MHQTYTYTVTDPVQKRSQVADVSAAVKALGAPPQEPGFNKHTHTLPTSAALLSKHKPTVALCTLGGGLSRKTIVFPSRRARLDA